MALIDNLVAYWPLDEASGNAIDAHGSNDLSDQNTVGSATGLITNARDFENGSAEYFNLTDNADMSTGDIDFTFSCWVKAESLSSAQFVLCKANFFSTSEYGIWWESDRFRWRAGTSTTVADNYGALSTGTWANVVAWHDSVNNIVGIAVNAGTANTQSYSSGVSDTGEEFRIGSDSQGFFIKWDGLICEVGFWKRVLTSTERTDLYNSGAGLAYPFSGGAASIGTGLTRSKALNRMRLVA